MTLPITRVGDLSAGVCSVGAPCCPHAWVSVHVAGSPNVFTNDRQTMRIGDIGISTCPHCVISYAVSGSSFNFANDKKIHRLTDTHIVPCGPGACISASPNTYSE